MNCHGFTPIVGRASGTELVVCGAPKEAKMETDGDSKEAQKQPKPLLGPPGEVVFCLLLASCGCPKEAEVEPTSLLR